MKKIIRKLGVWLLGISDAKSLEMMSLELNEFATKMDKDYSTMSIEVNRDEKLIRTEYSVYIMDNDYYSGKTFNEAMDKIKASYLTEKEVHQKDVLI